MVVARAIADAVAMLGFVLSEQVGGEKMVAMVVAEAIADAVAMLGFVL